MPQPCTEEHPPQQPRNFLPATIDDGDANNKSERPQTPEVPNESPHKPAHNSEKSTVDSAPAALRHVSFNKGKAGYFATGTDRGFRIYNCCELSSELGYREYEVPGGIGNVEMLLDHCVIALVGSQNMDTQNPDNTKVMMWNDQRRKFCGEISFKSKVHALRLRRNRIFVVLEHKIYEYRLRNFLRPVNQIDTLPNPKGICDVSRGAESFVLVCPGQQKGQVRVEHYSPSKKTKLITAHDSDIACLALSTDSKFVATASAKGTLVRVFNTDEGELVREFRRGADRAEIQSLAFSPSAEWLAVSSDKGTVHVFSLKSGNLDSSLEAKLESELPRTSSSGSWLLASVKSVLPKYFRSEWSAAQFRLPEGSQPVVASFGQEKHELMIVGLDGSFYRCKFDPAIGGEMTQIEYHKFY
ncbi:OLC1v1013398C1 [Oldenlandia corymbosa var. corymbosa]|uniref:OLC1v1013398C1 n=1 Tax=Oldenlandia corymbosa var. corymbosa TaxID=529605 RepID=A0AAV1DYE3_OLDCO|nr:OLC1v1013398C1 [Oldenlandia corymbosa var. corymbosa]